MNSIKNEESSEVQLGILLSDFPTMVGVSPCGGPIGDISHGTHALGFSNVKTATKDNVL
jgi:hypothetical protein